MAGIHRYPVSSASGTQHFYLKMINNDLTVTVSTAAHSYTRLNVLIQILHVLRACIDIANIVSLHYSFFDSKLAIHYRVTTMTSDIYAMATEEPLYKNTLNKRTPL